MNMTSQCKYVSQFFSPPFILNIYWSHFLPSARKQIQEKYKTKPCPCRAHSLNKDDPALQLSPCTDRTAQHHMCVGHFSGSPTMSPKSPDALDFLIILSKCYRREHNSLGWWDEGKEKVRDGSSREEIINC